MAVIFIGIATFFSTLLGGLFALRLRDKLHLILGFSAGAVIGVAFFDLLPEAFELGAGAYALSTVSTVVALGFLLYLAIDRLVLLHGHSDEEAGHAMHRGMFGAATLSLHSLLDGLSIGFAFQVSTAVGVIVALAVLAHDFSDGINTVNMVLKNQGERRAARRWLVVDAVAPVIGIAIAYVIPVTESQLGLLLAIFAGFFLYIGASDLIPESHHEHPTVWTTVMTLAGAAFLFGIIQLAHV
jgi:ZIP family zinc transporter